jgi:hypothetical protein
MAQTVVVLKRAHFFSIDNDIIDVHAKTIGAIGIAIYAVLARFANRRTGECWPAISRIQRTLKLGRSCVKRYLHLLQAEGLITIEERWSEEGDRTSNLYTLLDPAPEVIAHRHESRTAVPVCPAVDVEGGGSTQTPPPVIPDLGGRSPRDPEPDPTNQKTGTSPADAPPVKTLRQQTCAHPAADLHCIESLTICYHCWSILEEDTMGGDRGAVRECPDTLDTSHAA